MNQIDSPSEGGAVEVATSGADAAPRELGSWQLSLRMLFGLTFVAAIVLACVRQPLWLVIAPPAAALGLSLLAYGTIFPGSARHDSRLAHLTRWLLCLLPCVAIFALPIAHPPHYPLAACLAAWCVLCAALVVDSWTWWHRMAGFLLAAVIFFASYWSGEPTIVALGWIILPCIHLAAQWVLNAGRDEEQPGGWGYWPGIAAVAVFGALPLALILSSGWQPEGSDGWCIFLGLPLVVMMLADGMARVSILVLFLPGLILGWNMMPCMIDCWPRHDTARQYQRTPFWSANPGWRAIVRPGENTAILERYLGPAPFKWTSYCNEPSYWRYRMGKVDHYRYEEFIACVPEQERAHVLRAISDPENHLLHHQIYLLRILNFTDKPMPKDWWEKNRWAFDSYENPDEAVRSAYFWARHLDYHNSVPRHEDRMLLSREYARLIEAYNDLIKIGHWDQDERRPPPLPDLRWLR